MRLLTPRMKLVQQLTSGVMLTGARAYREYDKAKQKAARRR